MIANDWDDGMLDNGRWLYNERKYKKIHSSFPRETSFRRTEFGRDSVADQTSMGDTNHLRPDQT